ncbi:MAG: tetratricopeptide repeat protein [Acidobacteriota bacterium]|nr:tetratricopeptide repeat protein [Acidobacteriota bacterium]
MTERTHKRMLGVLSFFLLSAVLCAQRIASLSPAQQNIAAVQQKITAKPGEVQLHNELAAALIRRARETSDPSYFDQAAAAIQKSLRLSAGNFDGQILEATVLLGKHEFGKSLAEAKLLNKRAGDDLRPYALIADNDIALGNYKDAEPAAQWMLDLRSGNPESLLHGAILRELFGDPEGAIELMTSAYLKSPANDTEERAWILTRAARMQLRVGKPAAAEAQVLNALSQFAGYPYAVETLARVRMAQGKYKEAVALFKTLSPAPGNLYRLGQALEGDRQAKAAMDAFADFEQRARAEIDRPLNANRDLVLYYASRGNKPSESLRIARLEAAKRQDICTLDALAWALYANGDYAEARKQIDRVIAVGTRDAGFFNHAGSIYAKLNDAAAVEKYAKLSREITP